MTTRLRRLLSCLVVVLVLVLAADVLATSVASAKGPCGKKGSCATRPRITDVKASKVGEREVKLSADISTGGAETTAYEIWITTEFDPCEGAGKVPECPSYEPKLVRSGSLKKTETVSAIVGRCAYEYWFVAANSVGTTESAHRKLRPKRKHC
jgi:hypothetical protein